MFKTLMKSILFANNKKCQQLHEVYMVFITNLMEETINADIGYSSISELSKKLEKHAVLAYLPFVHFMVMMTKGDITKAEMIKCLMITCITAGQKISLVYDVFLYIYKNTTKTCITDACNGDWTAKHKIFVENGSLPIIVAMYHKAQSESTNVFVELLNAIDELESRTETV